MEYPVINLTFIICGLFFHSKAFLVCFLPTVWLVTNLLYLFTTKTIKFFSTQSSHLVAGLLLLILTIFENVSFLAGHESSWQKICSNHLILNDLIILKNVQLSKPRLIYRKLWYKSTNNKFCMPPLLKKKKKKNIPGYT